MQYAMYAIFNAALTLTRSLPLKNAREHGMNCATQRIAADKTFISGAGTAAVSWRAMPLMLPSGSKEIVIASGILFWK